MVQNNEKFAGLINAKYSIFDQEYNINGLFSHKDLSNELTEAKKS